MLSQKAQHRAAKQATTTRHAFLDRIDLSNAFLAAQGLPPSQKATHAFAKQPIYHVVDASVKRKLF